MATYRTTNERRDLVRVWTQSGLTAKQFAVSRGLSVASLMRWKSEQRSEPPPAVVPRVEFARLVRPATSAARGLVVEVSGARVRVEPGFDPELLASVVGALRGAT